MYVLELDCRLGLTSISIWRDDSNEIHVRCDLGSERDYNQKERDGWDCNRGSHSIHERVGRDEILVMLRWLMMIQLCGSLILPVSVCGGY